MAKRLLLSMKPRYADMVFGKNKTAELRRRISTSIENCDVFVYVSSPVRQLRGGFRIGQVHTGTPEFVWKTVAQKAGISKHEFDAYYEGREIAYALEITKVWEHSTPPGLDTLRDSLPDFVVPQSWRYISPEEYMTLKDLKFVAE